MIDSLNALEGDKQDLYRRLVRFASSGPRLIVAIADSGPERETAEYWEFAADVVLRLDKSDLSGYLLRTIEVVKARFQAHVWGKHQLKIYEPFEWPDRTDPAGQTKRLRAHPYRAEGGIFIFPSIHYVLSRYKRSQSESGGYLPSPVPHLAELLGSGFPKGRCIALIGGRGTHKSHLGYLQALDGVIRDYNRDQQNPGPEKAIIVSLRDDEGMTRGTMETILKECWDEPQPKVLLNKLEQQGRLEITYYPPFVAQEFFHRMLLSIHRMKHGADGAHITVLFNSLDQLSSRFPLCAEQRIFSRHHTDAVGGTSDELFCSGSRSRHSF